MSSHLAVKTARIAQRQAQILKHLPTTSFTQNYHALPTMTSGRPAENKASWLLSEGGTFEVRPAPMWKPEEKQVLLRVEAAAISPADFYASRKGVFKLQYPTIISSTVAGVVYELGPGITKVKVGERVVTSTNIWPSKGDPKFGAQQRYVVADELEITPIGDTLDFPTAIASSYTTPIQALFHPTMLNMIPGPSTGTAVPPSGKKILIWAGSTVQGALAISHAKYAGYTVISTCSAHNMELVQSLGADHVFDRSDKEATIKAIKALGPIDYFFDPISKAESLHMIAEILSDESGTLLQKADVITLMPPSMIPGLKLPEGIAAKFLRFSNRAEENKEFVKWYGQKGGYLESGLKGSWIRGVPGVVIGGLEKVEEGVDMLEKGVSGRRVVIEPWRD